MKSKDTENNTQPVEISDASFSELSPKSGTLTGKMRAAVFSGSGQIKVQFTSVPEPKENEVRLKLEGCGVCSSNLPVYEGRPWFNYPIEAGSPGHEGWGVIDAVGPGVRNLKAGDRAAVLSYHAYAEYDIAKADCVVPLPQQLKDKPFPGEPLSCALNIFRRSDIHPGQTVAVIGIGFLGALLTELVSKAGARVIAVSKRPFSLRIAQNSGAEETILMDDHYKIIEQVKELTNGEFCDRVIEATGKQWPVDLAGELTRIRGKLIIAGYHQDGMRQVNMQLWNWRGLDVINAHERDERVYIDGIREAIKAVTEGRLNPFPLFTHSFSLGQINEALDAAEKRNDGFIKALMKF